MPIIFVLMIFFVTVSTSRCPDSGFSAIGTTCFTENDGEIALLDKDICLVAKTISGSPLAYLHVNFIYDQNNITYKSFQKVKVKTPWCLELTSRKIYIPNKFTLLFDDKIDDVAFAVGSGKIVYWERVNCPCSGSGVMSTLWIVFSPIFQIVLQKMLQNL